MLMKYEVVLRWRRRKRSHVVFTTPRNADETVSGIFRMRVDLWDDMGQPEYITMTVEPGALLTARCEEVT